ncbi:Os03g0784000 [Oryza sativa Japonica Group]|uniref:Os03g0784000 protein n=1 Tax=Oryza sativa subsp. japonica TaxID=39947 RepID=A0A0P0W3V4_ORYSJ|nr:hypothetical protein EE612_020836 [Oryza sativa]BAS86708.1 Os03g0784000 [Oryza sativa Japonica Group]
MSAAAAAAAASAANVAVIGGGISGAVCASLLAARGVAVTLFDSGRGAGGRMAQRRCSTNLLPGPRVLVPR